jgi:hypothetical protein
MSEVSSVIYGNSHGVYLTTLCKQTTYVMQRRMRNEMIMNGDKRKVLDEPVRTSGGFVEGLRKTTTDTVSRQVASSSCAEHYMESELIRIYSCTFSFIC